MTRTSTSSVSCEPTGLTLRSSSALSSFTCSGSGMSPISSRNSVPPCAAWNSPRRSDTAPVNEPFLCPKSSDSSSPSGIAPQFTATNGAPERGLARWIARASSSLPVPLAPYRHTLASESATRRACASRSSTPEERVMISPRQDSGSPEAAGGLESRIASATVSSSTLGSKGLVRNENTPRRVAVTASGIVPCAVTITTGSEGLSRWIASNSAIPSMPCMRRSVTTTWGRATASDANAASPDSTAVTAYPDAVSRIAINCSRSLSSSTSRTRGVSFAITLSSSFLQAQIVAKPSLRRVGQHTRRTARQRYTKVSACLSAEHSDAPTMRLDQLARDGEAKPGALHTPPGGRGALGPAAAEEQIEDRLALLLRNPGPGIQNFNDGFSCDRV